MNFDPINDAGLLHRALQGDEEATKMYCGSYKLVTTFTGMYRTKEIGSYMAEVKEYHGRSVYDKDGFLLPIFWSLPRI